MEYLIAITLLLFLIVLPGIGIDRIGSSIPQERPIQLDGTYELTYMAGDGQTFEVADKALVDGLNLVIDENQFRVLFDDTEVLVGNYRLANSTLQFNVTTASDREMLGMHTAKLLLGDDVLSLTLEGEILIWQRA